MSFFKRNRKINFEKEVLVLCKIGLVTNDDSRTRTITWRVLPETRILIMDLGCYYEPNCYFDWEKVSYRKKEDTFLREGRKFVAETDNMPIQYYIGINLSEKERRTKKITLKRIKELEDLLNSK